MFAASKTTSVSGGYQISRSLRFNSADSAYLNRTPASAGNRRTWTWSAWVKRGKQGDFSYLFQGSAGNPTGGLDDGTAIRFSNNISQLTVYNLYNSSSTVEVSTSAMLRDPSAWYHIIVAMDTTQATSTDRVKVYVNGVQATLNAGGVYPTLNEDLYVNTTNSHLIGALTRDGGGAQLFNDGLMTEINFIDGQALTPSSFGETNAQTGVWQPKAYSGSYGTNGFYLNFSDNSNTTAATLGKDYSGNGNNWTPNNFSVTAGAGNDSLVDSPTSYGTDTGVGGSVRGNYATLNPLVVFGTSTFTNGNLDVSVTSTNTNNFATIAIPTSGKWYWEYQITAIGGGAFPMAGVIASGNSGLTSNVVYRTNGDKNIDGTGSAYGATYTTTDIIGVAVDVDGGTVTFYKNGTSQGAITYATSSGNYSPALRSNAATDNFTFNFGQRAFANTAPSGYKALCTQNLPTPTIGATATTLANKYFDVSTWSGTGSNISVTNSGSFQPDWVWAKCRSNAGTNNILVDAVRGTNYWLASDSTSNESALGSPSPITSFNSGGFSGDTSISGSGRTYVGWQWKANGSGSTNTSGSITSTVSANTTSGFSVVTYTGNGSNSTVGHGLGVAPSMVIVKNRIDGAAQWIVYHASVTVGATPAKDCYLLLNSTAAAGAANLWNSTAPTSSVFSVSSNSQVSGSSQGMVAYCFAEVSGYSKFGSYTGNGSTDGTFVYFGFRPAYVMIKASNAVDNWVIMDVARNPYNAVNYWLQAESSAAEATLTPPQFDFNSNGMKLRGTSSTCNASGVTYIYMAFASNPFKYSLAR